MVDVFFQTPDSLSSPNPPPFALRQQDAGYARLAAVVPPASCQDQPAKTSINWILRLPEVMDRVGICRASIYQRMNQGTFPKSVSLGPRSVGWLESEIDTWLEERVSARAAQKI
jgi:prophage regulatory protein